MDESLKSRTEWKQPDSEAHVGYDSDYVSSRAAKLIRRDRKSTRVRLGGGGGRLEQSGGGG